MTSSTGIGGIDHAAILVRDLAAAEAAYRRLGFRTTPIGRHNDTGTANHCVMFDRDFFELIAVMQTTPFSRQWADAAAEREGLRAIALAAEDVRATHARLRAAGFSPTDSAEFSRPVELPGGTEEARFTLTYLEPEAVPGIRVLVCQHHTRDLVWRPEYLGHPNATTGLSEVTLAVDDVPAAAVAYGRLLGARPLEVPGGLSVAAGHVTVRLLSADRAAAEFAGDPVLGYRRPAALALGFTVSDRHAARAAFAAAEVPQRELADGRLRVGSEAAAGVVLDFG